MHVHPSVFENTGLKPQLIQLLPRHGEDLIVTPFAQVFMLLSSCFMATTTWCKNLSDLGKFAQRSQQLHHPHQCAAHAQVEPHPGDHHSLLIARSRRPSLASGPAFTHLSRSEPSDENYVKVRRDNCQLRAEDEMLFSEREKPWRSLTGASTSWRRSRPTGPSPTWPPARWATWCCGHWSGHEWSILNAVLEGIGWKWMY